MFKFLISVELGFLHLWDWASNCAEQLSTVLCTQQALSISNIYWKMDSMDEGREALNSDSPSEFGMCKENMQHTAGAKKM